MSTLDEIAISIELTLISVIEGLALQSLAGSAVPVFEEPSMYIYIPFAIAGFLFILVFWSQSILHAVSFIRWPIRIGHMFLYFLAAFIQVVAYANLTDPLKWFFWWTVFALVSAVVYLIDLWIIDDSKETFNRITDGAQFLAEVRRRHMYEFKTLVPSAIAFNGAVFALLYFLPAQLNASSAIFWLGSIQVLVCVFALFDSMRNFKARSALIGTLFREA